MLAVGSLTHPLPPGACAWERNPKRSRSVTLYRYFAPLNVSVSLASFDFRGRRETRATQLDSFENSQNATRAHPEWCYQDLSKIFPDYTQETWGITSSSSPMEYRAWGGPPKQSKIDGRVVPYVGGSLMLTTDICIPVLHAMKDQFGGKIWGQYGLADAFNSLTRCVSTDTMGLNAGITPLSAENLQQGSVWHWFMANSEPWRGMSLAGISRSS